MQLLVFRRFAYFTAMIMLIVSISPLLSEYENLELGDGEDGLLFSQESYNRLSNNQLLIDESGGTGVSTAVDSYGHAHVSYYNTVSLDLMYSFFDGSGWQTVAVDTSGDTGESSALALNETDIPSIAYYSTTEAALKYATWDGDNWNTTTLDGDGDVGAYASVALDSEGDPHISYLDITRVRLKYTYLDDGVWTVMDVGDIGVNGTYSSIVLDNEDNPHIAFHEAVEDDLEYAYHNGTTWNITELETENSTGHQVSMVIDSNGNSHISFVDVTTQQLKYANNAAEGGVWNITSLTQVGVHTASTHGRTSIGLGLLEEPHITYYNASATSLGYIFHNGTEWESIITDDNGDVGQYSSMAVGPDGGVHVAYHDYTNDDLKYYFSTGIISEIIALEVGTNTESASPPDIALDSKGNPHLTYVNHNNGNLIYMHYNGTWNSEIVTTGASYHQARGHDPKIVVDENDVVHISLWYRQNVGSNPGEEMSGIIYAVKGNNATLEIESATGWALANVSGQGANLHHNDLVVDDLGRVHFVFAMSNEIWYAQYDYGTGVMSTMQVHERLGGSLGEVHSVSIDLDSSNNPNVAFSVGGVYRPTQTMYAKANVLLSWTVEVIENGSYDLGDDITIQVGTDDVPQIVSYAIFVDGGPKTYRHAVRNMTTGTWEASNMTNNSGSSGNNMDFKLDSANQPHITFNTGSKLHQASWDDGGWYQSQVISTSTSVQGGSSVGKYPSMIIDESDNAHVVHLRLDAHSGTHSVMYGFFGTQMPGRLSVDIDRDGVSNDQDAFPNDSSESNDTDDDGIGDNSDLCPGTMSMMAVNPDGCSLNQVDSDNDTYPDVVDVFPNDETEWNDTDDDGIGDNSDICPETMSMLAVNPDGCALNQVDSDNDTYTDETDIFPNDETEWNDTDADGFGDNSDMLPTDITQWNDTDSDGYGDNWGNSSWNDSRSIDWPGEFIEDATQPDYCPTETGNSTADGILGCVDDDGDGIADFLQTTENSTSSEESGNDSGGGLDEGNTDDDDTTEDNSYLRIEYIIGGIIAAIVLIMLLYAPLRIRKLKKRLILHQSASANWEKLDYDGDGEISDKEFEIYKEKRDRK